MPNFDRILSRIFLLSCSVIIFIIGVETLSFIYYQYRKPYGTTEGYMSSRLHWPRPFVMSALRPDPRHNINILGYIGPLPDIQKKDEFRIFLLGGSTVAEPPPHNIATYLESELRKKINENVRVYNFGVGSSISRQDLIRILIDVSGYEPDLIIHYGGGNEVTYGHDPRINYPHRYFLSEVNPFTNLEYESHPIFKNMILSSFFMRIFFQDMIFKLVAYDHLAQFQKMSRTGRYQKIKASAYIQNLTLSDVLSKHLGSDFIAFYQPLLFYKNTLHENEKRFVSPQAVTRQLAWREEILKQASTSNIKDKFIDISNIFTENTAQIYRDVIHMKDLTTNELIAKAMLPSIMTQLKKKKISNRQRPAYIPEEIFINATSSEK